MSMNYIKEVAGFLEKVLTTDLLISSFHMPVDNINKQTDESAYIQDPNNVIGSYLMWATASCYALRNRVKKAKTCRIYLNNI